MFRVLCRLSYLVLETSRCGAAVFVLQPGGVGHEDVKMTCPVSLDASLQSVVLHLGPSVHLLEVYTQHYTWPDFL